MARSTSTATTATPPALNTAPVKAPIPVGVEQFPEHWIRTRETPMSSPQMPATTMVAKAMARAFTGGNAVGPLAGSFGTRSGPGPRSEGRSGPGPVSDTRRS
jgi:hypothetical protein